MGCVFLFHKNDNQRLIIVIGCTRAYWGEKNFLAYYTVKVGRKRSRVFEQVRFDSFQSHKRFHRRATTCPVFKRMLELPHAARFIKFVHKFEINTQCNAAVRSAILLVGVEICTNCMRRSAYYI